MPENIMPVIEKLFMINGYLSVDENINHRYFFICCCLIFFSCM